ncbi:HAD family hydrolase [Verrucomicrobia bacterium S94]|nr:HAD family hydrolase [Verrucomicrobia bacterium S94]
MLRITNQNTHCALVPAGDFRRINDYWKNEVHAGRSSRHTLHDPRPAVHLSGFFPAGNRLQPIRPLCRLPPLRVPYKSGFVILWPLCLHFLMKFKHIIWDWNGTLWDDTWLCTDINNHMLERRGLPRIDIRVYRDKLIFPVDQYYCQLGFDYSKDPYNVLAEEFIEEYTDRRFSCPLHAGARELIAELQTLNVPQAVLSAYQHDTLIEALNHFQLLNCFDEVIGLNDIYAAGKVENGLRYIGNLKTDPSEVLFIGDTLHDFEVATAMGVNCALVAHGHNSRPRLESTGAPVFDDIARLRGYILG